MAKQMMITLLSTIFFIESFFISSSNSVPIILVGFPINQGIPLSLLSLPITEKNIKRVHRREVVQPESLNKQLVNSDSNDDLETAAGTNLLRPLFVYRQQMAYRDRNSKRLAERRRAIPDTY
ncbi:hypothetical protein PV327_001723 [Microctonus hyperodae]|uniref:Uncharacterized protein n=1 Tax=Microctonus hyperodae TaxID=165561 RepID=A0AA39FE41_MICHY|nr:hypothetical protein PV327_001723 [Microctonus hyperodae]